MTIATVLDKATNIGPNDIVISLCPTTFRQANLIHYSDANACNEDINNNVSSVYLWVGSKKLVPASLVNAPLLVKGSPNNFWKTNGEARYLVPEPSPAGSPISNASFENGLSLFFMAKETDNAFTHRLFSIFGLYLSLYTVNGNRTFEAKRLYTLPSGASANGTLQVAGPVSNTLHFWGVTVEPTQVSGELSATARLWLNGVNVASNTAVAWLQSILNTTTSTATTFFGSNGVAESNSSKFEFGVHAIYNAKIEASEVLDLYNTWKTQYNIA